MSDTAAEQPQLQMEGLDSDEVEARLAWLASAANEEEALLIEAALVTQTVNSSENEEEPQQ
jgi:hypothetical protein